MSNQIRFALQGFILLLACGLGLAIVHFNSTGELDRWLGRKDWQRHIAPTPSAGQTNH